MCYNVVLAVERNAQTLDLGHGAGDEGLRQHGDGGFARLDLAQGLGGLAAILDGNIAVGVNAVLGQDVAQNILGGSALAGGDDGLALQIPDRVDGLSVLDDVEHAQRVDAGNFHCTVRLVVERGGEVGGHSGGVQVSLDQQRHDFIGSAVHREVVVGGDLVAHQIDEAHRRGALQARDAQGGLGCVGGFFSSGGLGDGGGCLDGGFCGRFCGRLAHSRGRAAACQRGAQSKRRYSGENTFQFHKNLILLVAFAALLYYNKCELSVARATDTLFNRLQGAVWTTHPTTKRCAAQAFCAA